MRRVHAYAQIKRLRIASPPRSIHIYFCTGKYNFSRLQESSRINFAAQSQKDIAKKPKCKGIEWRASRQTLGTSETDVKVFLAALTRVTRPPREKRSTLHCRKSDETDSFGGNLVVRFSRPYHI
jgi:hypothetical protein